MSRDPKICWQHGVIAILVVIVALAAAALVIVDLCDMEGRNPDSAAAAAAFGRAR